MKTWKAVSISCLIMILPLFFLVVYPLYYLQNHQNDFKKFDNGITNGKINIVLGMKISHCIASLGDPLVIIRISEDIESAEYKYLSIYYNIKTKIIESIQIVFHDKLPQNWDGTTRPIKILNNTDNYRMPWKTIYNGIETGMKNEEIVNILGLPHHSILNDSIYFYYSDTGEKIRLEFIRRNSRLYSIQIQYPDDFRTPRIFEK